MEAQHESKKYSTTVNNQISTCRPTNSHRQWDCSTIAISSVVFVANNIHIANYQT